MLFRVCSKYLLADICIDDDRTKHQLQSRQCDRSRDAEQRGVQNCPSKRLGGPKKRDDQRSTEPFANLEGFREEFGRRGGEVFAVFGRARLPQIVHKRALGPFEVETQNGVCGAETV